MTHPVATLGIGDIPLIGEAALTMGVFDGVHRGHAAMLAATRAAAERRGIASVALVFDPHPDEVIRPGIRVARLAPLAVNLWRVSQLGIDHALPVRFDDALRSLAAEEFLVALEGRLALRALVLSPESAFGRGRSGTAERLRELGAERAFEVLGVDRVTADGAPISSSRIREAVTAGDLSAARTMGVAPYLEGTVVRGDGRGRQLGFPTANLAFGYLPVMPPQGIYAGWATVAASGGLPSVPALVSIGTRPTFHDHGSELVEVFLLDFDADLYGHRLGVELAFFLRNEVRFAGVGDLVAQMERDEVDARRLLRRD